MPGDEAMGVAVSIIGPSLGQRGPSLDSERYEISYRTLLKLLVRVANCRTDPVGRDLRVSVDQPPLHLGDQDLLVNLGHEEKEWAPRREPST